MTGSIARSGLGQGEVRMNQGDQCLDEMNVGIALCSSANNGGFGEGVGKIGRRHARTILTDSASPLSPALGER